METIIFACISLVFLIPILYFLPMGIAFREKVILMGAAIIAAITGLVANFLYNPWMGALLSFLLLVIFTYLFEKKTEIFAFVGKEQVSEDFSFTYTVDSTLNDKESEPVVIFNEQDDQKNEQFFRETVTESKEEIVDFDSEPDLDHIIFEEEDLSEPEEEINKASEEQTVSNTVLIAEEYDFFQNKMDVENSGAEYEDKQSASESDMDSFLEVIEPADDKEVLIEEGSLLADPTEEVEEWDEDLFLEVLELEETEAEVVDEWDEDLFLEVLKQETTKEEVVSEGDTLQEELQETVVELQEEEVPAIEDEKLGIDAGEEGKEPNEFVSLAELLESENFIEEADPLEENVYVEMSTGSEAAASLEGYPEWVGQNVVEEINSEEIFDQEVEFITNTVEEAPVMTDIDTSTELQEVVKEDSQSEMPVQKTKLQQELFQTLIEELKLAKKQRSDSDYELLVGSFLDDSLPHQDYYIFATMLIQQYVQTKNQEKLLQLLERLEDKFQAYPVVLAEISYLKNRFCKESY